ncbi:MAG TPA: gliding motility-associated ABC transporter permease subunit GldF [Bacteroidales bacterium]|nr:gliding motility-associated ABC transporter permease subunit GldF [Bacteroidales bacterium]
MFALFKKEINNFFNSLIGYIVIVVFLVIISLFLWVFPGNYNLLEAGFASLDGLFVVGPFVFLFLIPAITMRFLADEIRTKTIEILLTKPLTDLEIIFSKFFAGVALVLLSLIPTLIFVITIYHFGLPPGNLDMGGVWGSYLGLLFLGTSFVSIGLFASSLTENQVVSFITAVFLCGFIFLGFELIYTLELFGGADLFVRNLGIYAHYISMSRGVVDTRDLIYFISLTAMFIFLTKIRLQSRYW